MLNAHEINIRLDEVDRELSDGERMVAELEAIPPRTMLDVRAEERPTALITASANRAGQLLRSSVSLVGEGKDAHIARRLADIQRRAISLGERMNARGHEILAIERSHGIVR